MPNLRQYFAHFAAIIIVMARKQGDTESGKLGNKIYYTWHGRQCERSMPTHVANPQTEAQQSHRSNFAQISKLSSYMKDVVRAKHMTPIICEKGRRGHPLTDEQKESHRQKSKVRSRVEHVFGFMEQTMGGLIFRGVGMIRAKANIAMTNLVYNMCRLVQIKKYQPNLIAIQ